MVDLGKIDYLRRTFAALLQELASTWPNEDIEYVREEVGHGEYGDALENLIALGLQNGRGFSPNQKQEIELIASAMDMADSSFLVKLRQTI